MGSFGSLVRLVLPLLLLSGGLAAAASVKSDAEILFENRFSLFLGDPESGEVRALGVQGGTYDWSPDGDRIAFVSNPYALGGRPSELWIVNADGSGLRKATAAIRQAARPRWSPDGSRLALSAYDRERQTSQLYVVGADGSGLRRLVRGLQPAVATWSPDGERIAYLNRTKRVWSLFVLELATGRVKRLVRGAHYSGIGWSPDGSRISYVQKRRLYVIRADGTRKRRLSGLVVWGLHEWSPDGTRIAFESHQGPSYYRKSDIYTVRPDGSDVRRLTRGADRTVEDLGPTWSPDGGKLAFTSGRDIRTGGSREVYVMNADGTCERRLTRGAASLDAPAWRPGRAAGSPFRCVDLRIAGRVTLDSARVTHDADRVYRYEIEVANDGNETATRTRLEVVPAREATLLQASSPTGPCVVAEHVACELGDLAAGATTRITVRLQIAELKTRQSAWLSSMATARGVEPDADEYDNQTSILGLFHFCLVPEQVFGRGLICGTARGETIRGSPEPDRIYGAPGNDVLRTRDGQSDYVSCGAGRDRVLADSRDIIQRDCERVSRSA